MALLVDYGWIQLDFCTHALGRHGRHAASNIHLSRRDGLGYVEFGIDYRIVCYCRLRIDFSPQLFRSLRKGERAGNDPWDGRTLEWSIPSPPPLYNFARIPTVEGRDAFWLRKYVTDEDGVARPIPAGAADDDHGDEVDIRGIHIPDPSYFPIFVALGLAMMMGGIAFHVSISLVGLTVFLVAIFGWAFEPTVEPRGSE